MTNTLYTALFVVVVLTFTTCQSPLVTAQSFANCYLPSDDPDVTVCSWTESPLTFTDGTSLADSTLVTSCDTGASFTTYNCNCFIYVEDGTGVYDSNNYCNSCTLLSISATSFSIHWDCSNRLVGSCPIFDSYGCRTGDDPTLFPVASPTALQTYPPLNNPSPFPVVSPIIFPTDPPVDDPTPFPVEIPTTFQTNPPLNNPTPFPVVSPIIFPTNPPVDDPTPFKFLTGPVNEANEANVTVKSLKCNRRTRFRIDNTPTLPIDEAVEAEQDGDTASETTRCTTSDGNINRYHYVVGMPSFVMTIISMVLLV